LAIPDSSDFDFGTGDFTIDGWLDPSATSGFRRLIAAGSHADGANNMWFFGFGDGWGGGVKLNFGYYNGGGYTESLSDALTANLGTWYHWAVVRSGQYIYYFWNGTKVGTWNMGASVNINSGSTGLIVGARYYTNPSDIVEYENGYIDELRVSKGIARWTADFTPPTAAY
jgi:hypothetical protein